MGEWHVNLRGENGVTPMAVRGYNCSSEATTWWTNAALSLFNSQYPLAVTFAILYFPPLSFMELLTTRMTWITFISLIFSGGPLDWSNHQHHSFPRILWMRGASPNSTVMPSLSCRAIFPWAFVLDFAPVSIIWA